MQEGNASRWPRKDVLELRARAHTREGQARPEDGPEQLQKKGP